MASVVLYQLPETQKIRIAAIRNTAFRMKDLLVTYYERGDISLEAVKATNFDLDQLLYELAKVEKITNRMSITFGRPGKNDFSPTKTDEDKKEKE